MQEQHKNICATKLPTHFTLLYWNLILLIHFWFYHLLGHLILHLQVNPCEDADLVQVHDQEYIDKMKTCSTLTDEELIEMEHSADTACFHKVNKRVFILMILIMISFIQLHAF